MSQRKGPASAARISDVLGSFDLEDFGDPMAELSLFAGCESATDVRAGLRQQVEIETAAILDLVADSDAFDVIELMRMREFRPFLIRESRCQAGLLWQSRSWRLCFFRGLVGSQAISREKRPAQTSGLRSCTRE